MHLNHFRIKITMSSVEFGTAHNVGCFYKWRCWIVSLHSSGKDLLLVSMPSWPLRCRAYPLCVYGSPDVHTDMSQFFTVKATMLSFIKQTACVSFIYHSLHIFLSRTQSIYFYCGSFPCASVSLGSGRFLRDRWGSVAPALCLAHAFPPLA